MQREKEHVRVDRAKTCPFLIRVFYADNAHHQSQDFDGKVPLSEVQVHTWADVTFGELFETLRIELNLDKERRDARLSIALVYPKRDGSFSITPITELSTTRKSPEWNKQLQQKGFEAGDFVDVAILS